MSCVLLGHAMLSLVYMLPSNGDQFYLNVLFLFNITNKSLSEALAEFNPSRVEWLQPTTFGPTKLILQLPQKLRYRLQIPDRENVRVRLVTYRNLRNCLLQQELFGKKLCHFCSF